MFQKEKNVSIRYKSVKENKNRSLLRNTGAEIARYSILCFLDNDILAPPDFIQTHFNGHQKYKNAVLLSCRKCLVQFNVVELGEEVLLKNYELLNILPWYNDDRIEKFNENEPWRFVFSHSLSIDKEDFFRAGKFDLRFGEHWGEEDLELGFRLQLAGCKIFLLKEQFCFHQPHFEQSKIEQHDVSHNSNLLIQLHNCFECELIENFYTRFDDFYQILKELKTDFVIPNYKTQNKYDLILGCLFSSYDKISDSNMGLGIYCAKENQSCSNILIVNIFFQFPYIIQLSIISEAFRVGHKVYLNTTDKKFVNTFTQIAEAAGVVVKYYLENENSVFVKERNTESDVFIIFLPDVYAPEKRFIYLWLTIYLLERNCCVSLRDMKKIEKVDSEDFFFSKEKQKMIAGCLERSVGMTRPRFIAPLSFLMFESNSMVPDTINTYVIHDEDYIPKFDSTKYKNFERSKHFDESFFCCLTFLSAFSETKKYIIKKKESKKNNNDKNFCVFMENGFKEDGIDLVLEIFNEFVKQYPSANLTIKIPDYKLMEKNIYPLHNVSSKNNKLFLGNQKRQLDYYNLISLISKFGLESNVKVIQDNVSISELIEFIDSFDAIFFCSRGCVVPVEVYISIILGKKTFIGEHHIILDCLKQFCYIMEATSRQFSSELNVPVSCFNLQYISYRTEINDKILECLKDEKETISQEVLERIEKKAYEFIDDIFIKKKIL